MPAPLPTPVPARWRTARWSLPSLLFLAGTLPYLPLLGSELVGDGKALVEGHETLRTATRGPDRFLRLFREDYWDGLAPPSGLYRPLTTGALGIVYSVAGDRAWPYRLLGLLLHGALGGGSTITYCLDPGPTVVTIKAVDSSGNVSGPSNEIVFDC